MIDTVLVANLLVSGLRNLRWRVRQDDDSEIGSQRSDLVVTAPDGKVYLIEVKKGDDPVHFASIAQLERNARTLGEREGESVTPVLLTSQAVRQSLSEVADEVGVTVVESSGSESDQKAAESIIAILQGESRQQLE